MANRIYRWRKPVLQVTVTAGGTFVADTTYYIFGYFSSKYGLAQSYEQGHSPRSDVSTFQTTSVNRSISVAWKTVADIQSFEDGGVGVVKVNCTTHCLDTGDSITIMSGTYAGTYTITRVNYDQFTIAATYVDTYSTTWESSALLNHAGGIKLWCHTVNPIAANGLFINTYYGNFSHAYWLAGYPGNPVNLTAPPTQAYSILQWADSDHNDIAYLPLHAVGYTNGFFDTGNVVMDTVKAEFIAAGVYGNGLNIIYPPMYRFVGNICVTATYTSSISVGVFIFEGCDFVWASLTLYMCMISLTKLYTRSWISVRISDCAFAAYNGKPDVIPTIIGGTILLQCAINAALGAVDWGGFTMIGMNDYFTANYVGDSFYTGVYHDIKLYRGIIYAVMRGNPVMFTKRYFRDWYIDSSAFINFDIRPYNYDTYEITMAMQNIDTPRTDNLKIVRDYNTSPDVDIWFYRTFDLHFYNEDGDDLEGVNVKIVGDDAVEYNFTSGIDGLAHIDIIEQRSIAGNDWHINTITKNFVVTITKDGFNAQELYFSYAKKIADNLKTVCLTSLPDLTPAFEGTILMEV